MQHSLHDDRSAFSAAADHDRRASPSNTSMSCASWAAATTATCSTSVMQAASAASQAGAGSYLRQLFSEEVGAEAAGSSMEELLQLQPLPPAVSAVEASFDVLSSSDVYDTYASSHCSVEAFETPSAFSVEGFLTSGGSAPRPESPKQNAPHTLEFVSPPASANVSPAASSGCFQGMSSGKTSRRLDATAASPALLHEVQSSPADVKLCYARAKAADALHAKANSLNGDEEAPHTMPQVAASSFKKARLQASEPQGSGAGNDSSQFQSIMSRVQSARSKEKLGERINALQQLVSPFGKTDTASVLSEAIGYIKFLQEQVQVLSSPYMKPTSTFTRKDVGAESTSDLRSRGLCLVPVSCTLNVANNNNFNIGADYWASTPSVGGSTLSTRFSASS